jgi:hypothetical protein
MAFWDEFGDSLLPSLFRCKSQSFQLIHDHRQRSPTWSLPSEAMESSADSLSSHQLAAMLQRQFDEEDHFLAMEQQRVFDCGVCLDMFPEESIARIDPCGHSFCRECVRGLIESQIESRRFPVLCPTCTAEPEKNRPESIGSYVSLIHSLGNQANSICVRSCVVL